VWHLVTICGNIVEKMSMKSHIEPTQNAARERLKGWENKLH
jgi:hypothetical protein